MTGECLPELSLAIGRYLAAGGLAAAVGFGELVSRYREDIRRLIGNPFAWAYVLINLLSGMAVLLFIRVFQFEIGVTDGRWLAEILVAGFGAIAFFRASLFTAKVGGADVAIGPGAFLQMALAAVDRGLSRRDALPTMREVPKIMQDVIFDKAKEALPMICFGSMQNLAPEEQKMVGEKIKELDGSALDPADKSIHLGLLLAHAVGLDVLREGVAALGDRMKQP